MTETFETPDWPPTPCAEAPEPHWKPVDAPPELDRGGLHLWRIPTAGPDDDLDLCLTLLGEDQRRRAQAMTRAQARERYIRSNAGLRSILGLYLRRPPQTVALRRGPAGKPYLADPGGTIELNLTNSGDLALVAIGRMDELGVDCEEIRPRRDLESVARRMFAPEQIASILGAAPSQRLLRFYLAWTALEADAKSDGRGLFRPRASTAPPPRIVHFCPQPGYVAALARAHLPPLDEWQTLEPTGPLASLAP